MILVRPRGTLSLTCSQCELGDGTRFGHITESFLGLVGETLQVTSIEDLAFEHQKPSYQTV